MLKLKLILNKKKNDINGNAVYNVSILKEENNKTTDITSQFTCLSGRRSTLKNGTINVKEYRHILINELTKKAKIVFGKVSVEVVEKYHK